MAIEDLSKIEHSVCQHNSTTAFSNKCAWLGWTGWVYNHCYEEATEKLVLVGEQGEQAGISVGDMIVILNTGVSVETLLDLIGNLRGFS